MATLNSCRLCCGSLSEQFRLTILGKHDVGFARCNRCESLQTETTPFWLDEAYADQRRFFDTGAVQRNQTLQARIWYLRWAFRLSPSASVLDWGGSDGLLTRMLRDIGLDAYHYDRYALNHYAAGFEDTPGREYDLITASEVYEHLPEPAETIASIFERKPLVHFVVTTLYREQTQDWEYIWPATGRHVFFFSEKAMRFIAESYGYSLLRVGSYTIFHRPPLSGLRRLVLVGALYRGLRRSAIVLFAAFRGAGRAASDRVLMCNKQGRLGGPLSLSQPGKETRSG